MIMNVDTCQGNFGPSLESFLGDCNGMIEFFFGCLGGLSDKFLSDGISDIISFGGFGINELTIDKVFDVLCKGVPLEFVKAQHKRYV